MVAKAAYAIDRGFFQPKEIVMLAFNKDAAKELAERAEQSFARLGMDNVKVRAKTFHRLGLAIIGYATKKKPRVPDWVVKEKLSFQKLEELAKRIIERFRPVLTGADALNPDFKIVAKGSPTATWTASRTAECGCR